MSCRTVRNRVRVHVRGEVGGHFSWGLVGVPKSHVLPGACHDAGAVYMSFDRWRAFTLHKLLVG